MSTARSAAEFHEVGYAPIAGHLDDCTARRLGTQEGRPPGCWRPPGPDRAASRQLCHLLTGCWRLKTQHLERADRLIRTSAPTPARRHPAASVGAPSRARRAVRTHLSRGHRRAQARALEPFGDAPYVEEVNLAGLITLEAGHWLATHVDRIDLAVVSTAERARATWDLASAELGERPRDATRRGRVRRLQDELLDVIHSPGEVLDTVVIVGHTPGLEGPRRDPHRRPGSPADLGGSVIESQHPWRSADRAPGLLRAAGRPPTG